MLDLVVIPPDKIYIFFFFTERSVKYTTESCVKGKDHDEQQAMILHKKERRAKIPTNPKKSDFQKS